MSKTIEKFLRKIFYAIVNPIKKLYWYIFRPHTRGVKCIVMYQGKVLLVRLGYAHKRWTIPGGGVQRGETDVEAVCREIKEEVGITITNPRKITEYTNTKEYKVDTVNVFLHEVKDPFFNIDGFEIAEAGWFFPELLPLSTMPRVYETMEEYKKVVGRDM